MSGDRWADLRAAVQKRPISAPHRLPDGRVVEPLRFTPETVSVSGRLLTALLSERDDLDIAINGGCGCAAPYDQCSHDEPLRDAHNRMFAEAEALASRAEAAEAALKRVDALLQEARQAPLARAQGLHREASAVAGVAVAALAASEGDQ